MDIFKCFCFFRLQSMNFKNFNFVSYKQTVRKRKEQRNMQENLSYEENANKQYIYMIRLNNIYPCLKQ